MRVLTNCINQTHILSNKPIESLATRHGSGLKSPACSEQQLRQSMNAGSPASRFPDACWHLAEAGIPPACLVQQEYFPGAAGLQAK
jgi:hypothetical protein